MDLRISASSVGDATVIALDGTADLAAAPALHAALARACSSGHGCTVAVDLDGLAVLDDVALGLLLGAAARVREGGGALVLVCTAERILERLASTRLDQVIEVRSSITGSRSVPITPPATVRWTPSGSSATC